MKNLILFLTILLFSLSACETITPINEEEMSSIADKELSVEGFSPSFGVAGNSGCYTVEFILHESGQFPSFSGTTTGDVIANSISEFEAGATVFNGITIGNEGVSTFSVTGGIPELIGHTFSIRQEGLTISQPDNDPFIWSIHVRAKAFSGVAKANLTGHGTFDLRDLTPPFEVDLVWRGVICP